MMTTLRSHVSRLLLGLVFGLVACSAVPRTETGNAKATRLLRARPTPPHLGVVGAPAEAVFLILKDMLGEADADRSEFDLAQLSCVHVELPDRNFFACGVTLRI